MSDRTPLHLVALYGPLLLLGMTAGALRFLSRSPGLPRPRRRALAIGWVLLILVGTPLWLFLAATLRL